MSKQALRRRNLFFPAKVDDTVIELANRWGVSIPEAYNRIIDEGLEVENVLWEGGDVIARLPENREDILFSSHRRSRSGLAELIGSRNMPGLERGGQETTEDEFKRTGGSRRSR